MSFRFPLLIFYTLFSFLGCENSSTPGRKNNTSNVQKENYYTPYLVILGTTQDAGSPQIGCRKKCCKDLFIHPDQGRQVVSLGLIDPINKKKYLFEATPDITRQTKNLLKHSFSSDGKETPDAIFLTHAHIGHYSGLMYLGREAMNTDKIPVYTMPRMKSFLENNGPWNQLIKLQNIVISLLANDQPIDLNSQIKVSAFTVPHRDEYSETAGFLIEGPKKKVLFIPDIDKWEKWERNIIELISRVDFAFIDGTFYDAREIGNRNLAEIPHPFIVESMTLFKDLTAKEKSKIFFIHFNHTNPVLNEKSQESATIRNSGFELAKVNQVIEI